MQEFGAQFLDVAVSVALVAMLISAGLTVYRLMRGPSLADRVVALDMLALLGIGFIGIVAVATWSAIASYVIILIARGLFGLRVPEEDEIEGLDITSHGERGYDL